MSQAVTPTYNPPSDGAAKREFVALFGQPAFLIVFTIMLLSAVGLNAAIKALGLHSVPVHLHPEVDVKITINVARSAEEAERQARGESTIASREEASMDDLGLEVGAALAEAGDVEM